MVLLNYGNLQHTMKTYTIAERARVIYETVSDVFDYNSNSDVLTPAQLVQKQVNSIPLIAGKVLIPGAGIGSYIPALLEKGVSPSDIYAIEISPAYSRLGSRIFSRFGVNYIHADFLTWRPEMQFDVIIGNPPYQKSKYSDFYVCFIHKAAECLKEGGYFSMIMPAKGANPMSRAQSALDKCGWSSIELGVEKYFPNIGTVIGHYRGFKGSATNKLEVVVGADTLEIERGTVLPLGTTDKLAYSVVAKIFNQSGKMPFFRTKKEPAKNYVYVSRMIGTWHPTKSKGGPYALQAFINECPGNFDGGFLNCDSLEQAESFAWSMSRSLVMRFAVNQCARAAFIPPMFWSLTPDLRDCNNDEDIAKALGFTESEQNYIKQWDAEGYK